MKIFDVLEQRLGQSHFRIIRGVVFVTTFMVIGKVIAAGKEMAIAYRFGVDSAVDIYVFAFVLVSWIPSIAQSVLQSVTVPLLNKYEGDARREFVGQLTAVLLLLGTISMLLAVFFMPLMVPALASSMYTVSGDTIKISLIVMAPIAVFLFLVALYSAELLSREMHANTLLEAVTPLCILLCVLLWPKSDFDLAALLIGTLLGSALHAVVLYTLSMRHGSVGRIRLSLSHPAWTSFWKSCSVLVLGAFILSIVRPFDQFLAANLGEGAISSLSYATRLLALGLAIGTTVLSRSILPVLSDSSQTIDSKLDLAVRWSSVVFLLGVVAAVVAWVLSPWAVRVLFERGMFTAQNTDTVSEIVRAGLVQLPFMMSGLVLVQLFASLGDYRRIAFSGVVGVFVKVTSGYLLSNWLGVPGITLATGLMYIATFSFFLWSVKYRIDR